MVGVSSWEVWLVCPLMGGGCGVVSVSSHGRWVGVWLVCPLMGGGWGCG